MSIPVNPDAQGSSTRPYLIRALHDWCTDNGFTPYIAVHVDGQVHVPLEYVKDQEIVLNVGFEATSALKLGNEWIEFNARFGGVAREIQVPVDHVVAIYARENGQGMAFPMPTSAEGAAAAGPEEPQASGKPAVHGLRLAGVAPQQPAAPVLEMPPPKPPTAPEEPPKGGPKGGGGGPRPALKRVK